MNSFFRNFNKQFFVALLATVLLLAGRTSIVLAAEEAGNHIIIEAKGDNKNLGIFNDKDGFWYPGRTLTKEFTVKSNNEKDVQFNKFFVNVQPLSSSLVNKIFNFDDQLYKQFSKYLKVTLKDKDSVFYDGTFEDFSSKGVELSSPIKISPNSQKDFELTLYFDEKAGNDYQNLTHKFNIALQYTLVDESSSINTPIPPIQVGDKLPQTGRFVDFATLLSIGLMLAAAGFFLLDSKTRNILKIFKARGVK